jgi:hypothetical protein
MQAVAVVSPTDAQRRAVAETLARILTRKHPGSSWTSTDGGSDTSAGAIVVQLSRPHQLDAIPERGVSAARAA